MQSAVEFSTRTRIHVALEASDVERSTEFYRLLLGEDPSKIRDGYAKFEPADPPVNLTLNRAPEARPASSHFGVQVKSTEAVQEAAERFRKAGYQTDAEDGVECCYSVQDKVWVSDPDGNRWEIFVVIDNEAPSYGQCCTIGEPGLVQIG